MTVLPYHIPLIVSNCGGLTEPLSINPDIGILIDSPLSCDSITESIQKSINQKDKYLLIKETPDNWKEIEDFYDWSSISYMTLKVYYSN
ncbi:hypothetical protein [Providencia sneebia]|uniref:Glycosyltransferase n=1 Tax=Providencia sneebia DSM 19967 TaxID=1141660 RepID=K8WKY5_9GAMM|nr:hypothetical protein OO7_01171 [Providencia sneebia DSM 19967]